MNECIQFTLEQSTQAQNYSSILFLTCALDEGETPARLPDSHLYRVTNTKLNDSKLQPTRCNLSWFIYFLWTLYMFQVVLSLIIRST